MIYTCKPTRIGIYVNSGYKSAAAVQKELGCDVLLNGGLYDMRTFTPSCWLKKDGQLLHGEAWSDWGYGWDTSALTMDSSVNIGKYRNFLSCVCLLRNGKAEPLHYDAALGGKRGRSAVGVRANGEVVVCCVRDGSAYAMTPEQLQAEMLNCGCVSALMLDGGLSSQCITPAGSVTSSRIVENFIAIWTGAVSDACPYPEPTRNVGRRCWLATRDMNRWVQWQLNRHGANLDVDGVFGKLSDAALRAFQASHGLTADGICGKLTREALKL